MQILGIIAVIYLFYVIYSCCTTKVQPSDKYATMSYDTWLMRTEKDSGRGE